MKRPPVRQHIINTASDLFYNNGYNRTGINEIITQAGIAKATLYNHFKSKEEICLAYLVHMQTNFLSNITEFLLSKPTGKKRVLGIFDFVLEFYNDKAFNGCWCINTISELPREDVLIRAEIRSQKTALLELISSHVTESYPAMRKSKRDELSRKVYLLYEGAVSESYLHDAQWPIDTARKLCKELLE